MSKIKTLADQLKSKLEEQKGISEKNAGDEIAKKTSAPAAVATELSVDPRKLSSFLKSLREFKMDGQEKILIRIDKRSMNVLRQFKTATNIEMTRVIAFSLHQFLKGHPWLNEFISQTLKNQTHELD